LKRIGVEKHRDKDSKKTLLGRAFSRAPAVFVGVNFKQYENVK